ncbi:DapH/DapD/GlmU-related protein [Kaistia defluvii]|uniref:DapH/DapD/GlmU-related protein n=1 Tax=Kaistia defluvii TaxID=410841 RepID=UPI0022528F91|nr:DapH/DapD/GlmU-related protein [Kaistia defluvii]MCX5518315.1 DapH/DapD/GlmU-related protein [Kaistia defluvii]
MTGTTDTAKTASPEDGNVLGFDTHIHPTAVVTRSKLGSYVDIGERVLLDEVEMGDFSYFDRDAMVNYATIGKFCSIAASTRINPGNHPMWRATQHHFTYRARRYGMAEDDDSGFFQWRRDHHVTIGHDVWIGHGAVVLAGVSVGTGAIIAAGAVVSKPVEPYTIVAGVPATPIKRRFPEAIADRLMALAWWDWPHARLRETLLDFRSLDIEAFLDKHEPTA